MPGVGTKQQKSEPLPPIGAACGLGVAPSAVLSDFEQMCVELSASGALIAVREMAGLRCTVSFGSAPTVGSRLPADFPFLNQCVETGEFALCDDAQSDPRIPVSLATSLSLRSAVAVPVQAQGSVVGLMEVFCSEPSAIHPIATARLTEIAKSFAALMIFDAANGGLPVIGGPLESPIVLPRLVADSQSAPDASPDRAIAAEKPDQVATERAEPHEPGIVPLQKPELRRAAAARPLLPSDRPIPPRVWLIAAALLVGLALLLLLLFRVGSDIFAYQTNTGESASFALPPPDCWSMRLPRDPSDFPPRLWV